MANGNIIVTSTINRVSWQVDQNSFTRARNKINSLKKFAESAGKSFDQATRKLQQANGKTQLTHHTHNSKWSISLKSLAKIIPAL